MENNIYKTKVYVYGILNANEEIIYVGKTSAPKKRLVDHKRTSGWNKMKILDFFYDKEMHWINKLKSECKLENKEIRPNEEDWEIGERVEVRDRRVITFIDKVSNTEYKTIAECSAKTGLTRARIVGLLYSEGVKQRNMDKYRFELL